jgi:hypothetical protein
MTDADLTHVSLADIVKAAVLEALTEAKLTAPPAAPICGGHADPHKIVHDLRAFGHQPKTQG